MKTMAMLALSLLALSASASETCRILREEAEVPARVWRGALAGDCDARSAYAGGLPQVDAYRALIHQEGYETDPTALIREFVKFFSGHESLAYNAQLMLDPAIAEIRPMAQVEALFLEKLYAMKPDGMKALGEYSAYVGTAPNGQMEFLWAGGESMGSAPGPTALKPYLEQMIAQGLAPLYHVHNHPFIFGQRSWHGGTILPSDADVNSWKSSRDRFRTEEARITNGFDTSAVKSDKFSRFR